MVDMLTVILPEKCRFSLCVLLKNIAALQVLLWLTAIVVGVGRKSKLVSQLGLEGFGLELGSVFEKSGLGPIGSGSEYLL